MQIFEQPYYPAKNKYAVIKIVTGYKYCREINKIDALLDFSWECSRGNPYDMRNNQK